MELLPIVIVLSIGFAALFVFLRRAATTQGVAAHEQAVSAAVSAALAERGATAEVLGRDREATVQAAVARAAEVADAKLDARLRSGTERLEANMALGHQKYDASASIIEKQNSEMRLELKRVEKMLTELQEKTAGQHGAVVNQLQQAAQVTSQLQQTTGSLRDALGSSKKRGNWGERMAQDVLTHAGMVEGLNYRMQKGIESGGRPDFTILMPRQMVLHMDVKFPADNYLLFLDAEQGGSTDADSFRKQFVKDARARVKELSARKYHEEADSIDTVVLFIPNESVFGFVQENDPGIMDEAMQHKIVLCGPSTLVAVLQVVRQAMDNFMLERRSNEIMECLSGFKNEWVKFSDKVTQHGKQLDTAMRSFHELSGTRSNQLQRQLNRIDELQGVGTDENAAVDDEEQSGPTDQWPPLREVASA